MESVLQRPMMSETSSNRLASAAMSRGNNPSAQAIRAARHTKSRVPERPQNEARTVWMPECLVVVVPLVGIYYRPYPPEDVDGGDLVIWLLMEVTL